MKQEEAKPETIPANEPCLRFQAVLLDYLEGGDRPEIPAHARECDYCRCLLVDLQVILKASSEPEIAEPPVTLWSSIRTTLVAEGVIIPQKRGFWERWVLGKGSGFWGYSAPIMATAAVIIAAIVLFKSPGYLNRSSLSSPPYTLHAAAFMQDNVKPQDMNSLRQTIDELEQAYRANQASLEPSMRSTYAKSLESLNDEIRDCQVSMKQEPGNGLAQDYLSHAYVEKVQLLQTALEYNLR